MIRTGCMLMTMFLSQRRLGRWFGPLVDLLFPPRCLHCEQIITTTRPHSWLCANCQARLTPMAQERVQALVLDRLEVSWLDRLLVGWEFSPEIRSLIHHLKYQKMPSLGVWLGEQLAQRLTTPLSQRPPFRVLPVPLHPSRLREREYNQSLQIARGLVHLLPGAHLEPGHLERIRATVSQTGLNRQQRRANVLGAFALSEPQALRGSHLLLVDDVVTTGATINECARMLKNAGAAQVWGIAVATPPLEEG